MLYTRPYQRDKGMKSSMRHGRCKIWKRHPAATSIVFLLNILVMCVCVHESDMFGAQNRLKDKKMEERKKHIHTHKITLCDLNAYNLHRISAKSVSQTEWSHIYCTINGNTRQALDLISLDIVVVVSVVCKFGCVSSHCVHVWQVSSF